MIDQSEIKSKVKQALERVSLEKNKNTLAINLSGGMRRRLSIALGILGSNNLLILDEPTTGLDPVVRDEVWTLVNSLRHDRCILMAT
jgi:ABC-type multidrug transport system ATPase subunit